MYLEIFCWLVDFFHQGNFTKLKILYKLWTLKYLAGWLIFASKDIVPSWKYYTVDLVIFTWLAICFSTKKILSSWKYYTGCGLGSIYLTGYFFSPRQFYQPKNFFKLWTWKYLAGWLTFSTRKFFQAKKYFWLLTWKYLAGWVIFSTKNILSSWKYYPGCELGNILLAGSFFSPT